MDEQKRIQYALRTVLSREQALSHFPSEQYREGFIDGLRYACVIAKDPATYVEELDDDNFDFEELESILSKDINEI